MLGSLNISGIWYRYFSCERSKEEKSKEYSNKSYALTLNTDISINKNNLEERKLKKKKKYLQFCLLFHIQYTKLIFNSSPMGKVNIIIVIHLQLFFRALSRKKTPVKVQPKTYPIMFFDPPILPEDNSFIGIPVYVNFDAIIYVQELRGGNWIIMASYEKILIKEGLIRILIKMFSISVYFWMWVFRLFGTCKLWFSFHVESQPLAWQLPKDDLIQWVKTTVYVLCQYLI